MTKQYNAPPTIRKFLRSSALVQALLGPVGGGKTTGVIMKILYLGHLQAADANGRRRTRWGVVRNTRQQLKDSVLKSVFEWLPPDGQRIIWRESDMTMLLRLPQPDDTVVEIELMVRGLDEEADARRLLSVEFTGVWFSEFREIRRSLLKDALSRCGRFPSAADGGPTWYGLLMESNMPVRGSEWFNYLEVERPTHTDVFKQPSGVAADAENLENLPPNYYSNMLQGSTESWLQAHVYVQYPDALDGTAVHAKTFSVAKHVSEEDLKPVNLGPVSPVLLVGIDQGRNPAATLMQVEASGRVVVHDVVYGEDMGMEYFMPNTLMPVLTSAKYAGMPILAVYDPASEHKTEVNDVSPADVIKQYLRAIPAPTNNPGRRIEAVDRLLMRERGFLISKHVATLISTLASEYKFKMKRNGEKEDLPEKKHPWSDVADSLQYASLVAGGANYGRVISRGMGVKRLAARAPAPARGWT